MCPVWTSGKWGDRRGLNPRQPESQSGALPTELRPPQKKVLYRGVGAKFQPYF